MQGRAPRKKQPGAEKPGHLGPRFGHFVGFFFSFPAKKTHDLGLGLSGVVRGQAWEGPPEVGSLRLGR